MSNNWRTQVNAVDYLGQQKKATAIEQRRPTIRKSSDLVGPGIGAAAVRLDDYNNLLATFNGYYSSEAGALNAPNTTEAFVGQVVSDAELGGRQIFTGLTSGTEYSRVFTRSPTDPESIGWGLWRGQRIPPTAMGNTEVLTFVPQTGVVILAPPILTTLGEAGVYERSDVGIRIRKQGVYTGHIQLGCGDLTLVANVNLQKPFGNTSPIVGNTWQNVGPSVHYPFTVWAYDESQGFSVAVDHAVASTIDFWWRFQCTRVGDAV